MIDWEQVRIDAAISAMQGVLEGGKIGEILEAAPDIVAKQAVRLADALVEELKKAPRLMNIRKFILSLHYQKQQGYGN